MVKTRKRSLFSSAIVSMILSLICILVPLSTTQAKSVRQSVNTIPTLSTIYRLPPWWNGNCDDVNYFKAVGIHPSPLGSAWRGIQICGPRPYTVSTPDHFVTFPGGSPEQEFECTELVKRYLYLAYNFNGITGTYGYNLVDNYAAAHSNFHMVPNNGTIPMMPVEGDVLSFGTVSPGHTSIVESVNRDGSLNVIEQNENATGRETLSVSGWKITGTSGGLSVKNWMTPRPLPATSTTINFSFSVQDLNSAPKHTTRIATVKIFNASGNVVETNSQNVTYHSGIFSGAFFTKGLAPGSYTANVKLSNTISKAYGGFFTTPTAVVNESGVVLKLGDINNDNIIDILDYNDLLSCWGSKFTTCAFNPNADLNDDGVVDGIDYNIYLRSAGSQGS